MSQGENVVDTTEKNGHENGASNNHVVDAAVGTRPPLASEEDGGNDVWFEEATDARLFGIGSRKPKKSDQDDAAAVVVVAVPPQTGTASPLRRPAQQQRPVAPEPRFIYDETSYFYRMNHGRRGTALVLNYEQFSPDRYDQASTRRGSSVDAASLVSTFSSLGFDVQRFDNLKTSETLAILREIALGDHSQSDCLAIAVLSHGDQGPGGETVFYTYDKTLRITDDLVARFTGSRCESLRAKPKLFFIQACQGAKTDQGVYVQIHDSNGNGHTNGNGSTSAFSVPRTVHIPDEADVLVAYSTPPGYYSWRNETEGSWFITELCSSLCRWAFDLDITQVLTRVCFNVANGYASRSSDPRMTNMKQCPTFVSRLTKQLRFTQPVDNVIQEPSTR